MRQVCPPSKGIRDQNARDTLAAPWGFAEPCSPAAMECMAKPDADATVSGRGSPKDVFHRIAGLTGLPARG